MMDAFDLASRLFGNSRAESRGDVSNSLDILTATGAGDSSDGAATVCLDADVTPADDYDGDDYAIGIPTSPNVIEGDGVLVGLTGSGPLKTPVVISNPGSGDRMQVQISNAETLAEQAEAVATATGQHFWSDTDGAHVTEVTREEWEGGTQTGANSLWNSLGMLFRDGLHNLLAVLTSGIAIYDGSGNAASNILAEFMSDHVRVGGNVPVGSGGTDVAGAAVQFFDQTDTHGSGIEAAMSLDEASDYYDMRSDVIVSSQLADAERADDTGSTGNASLSLEQWMGYGVTGTGEQFTETHSALVADSTYDGDGQSPVTSHARVSATATTGSTYANGTSYVELIADALGVGTDEGSIDYVVMRQVICALLHPSATYTPLVGTWTTGAANAWETAGFGVVVTESGRFTDYIDVASKGVGEFVALVGCTVRVSACVTWVDSVAGRRSVGAFVNATRSGTRLSGGTEYSNSGLFYTGSNAKTAQLTPVVLHLAAGNRLNIGKYAPANAVQSNQAYKMNWVTIEVLSVD